MPRKGYSDPLSDVTPKTFRDVAKRITNQVTVREDLLKIRGRILDEIGARIKNNDFKSVRALGLRALDSEIKGALED
jgi:hypothetical protein